MVPLIDPLVKFVDLSGLKILGRFAPSGSGWHIEVEFVRWRVKSVDNHMDECPEVARAVKPGVKELASIDGQVDNADLREKDVEDIQIPGFAWVKESVARESCLPVVNSDSEVKKPIRESVIGCKVFGVLDSV